MPLESPPLVYPPKFMFSPLQHIVLQVYTFCCKIYDIFLFMTFWKNMARLYDLFNKFCFCFIKHFLHWIWLHIYSLVKIIIYTIDGNYPFSVTTCFQCKQQYQRRKIPRTFHPSGAISAAPMYYQSCPSSLLIVIFWDCCKDWKYVSKWS